MIRINGVKIKEPTEVKIERFNLTKSGRLSSGKMTMDLIAKKRKLELKYDVISGAEMRQILDLIDTDAMFFRVDYEEDNGMKTMTAYVGAIPTDYFRKRMGWYWRNVSFSLIEQ